MPELPEVETVLRRVRPLIVGKVIVSAEFYWKRTVGGLSQNKFLRLLAGKEIEAVTRRAKYIIISLKSGGFLVVHLRMSGDLIVSPGGSPPEKHLRVRVILADGSEIRFVDTRKFGRFVYVEDITTLLARLGPEPLDIPFDVPALHRRLSLSKRTIKTVLLDQEIIAGLGNIYAVETLWRAKIHPLTRVENISLSKVHEIVGAAHDILREAIDAQGTDLGDGVWKTGGFTPSTYGRDGEPCHRCGTKISKIRVAQRGTEFCGRCQKQPKETYRHVRRRLS